MNNLNEVLLVAQESNGACTGCVFYGADESCTVVNEPEFDCTPEKRADRKHVIWVITKNGETNQ